MPGTYFCFSDESGDYKPRMGNNLLQKHPFYIRTTLIINSSEWKRLNSEFRDLKEKYGLPLEKELKWSHLWTRRVYEENNKTLPVEIRHLEKYSYKDLTAFVDESLGLISRLKEKKIIATYTKNAIRHSHMEKTILAFHLQEHMQRLEMELNCDPKNLGVLFFDPVSVEKNELFRAIYNDLFENGDFIKRYEHIKDSLNIENSHHSVGIQIADYVSGSFSSILKSSSNTNYTSGVEMFFKHVYPNLRISPKGNVQGYGIREVPCSVTTRSWLESHISAQQAKNLTLNITIRDTAILTTDAQNGEMND